MAARNGTKELSTETMISTACIVIEVNVGVVLMV